MSPVRGFIGWRLTLELKEIRHEGELLESIRKSTADIVGPEAGVAVKHVGFFRVAEVRPLV